MKIKTSPLRVRKKTNKSNKNTKHYKKRGKNKSKKQKKIKKSIRIYCGNNANAREVRTGQSVIGTRYTCLRKGFGTGYYEAPNLDFLDEYVPIDDTKIYCGNKEILPDNYDRFGSLSDCMRKGYGAGKRKRANEI